MRGLKWEDKISKIQSYVHYVRVGVLYEVDCKIQQDFVFTSLNKGKLSQLKARAWLRNIEEKQGTGSWLSQCTQVESRERTSSTMVKSWLMRKIKTSGGFKHRNLRLNMSFLMWQTGFIDRMWEVSFWKITLVEMKHSRDGLEGAISERRSEQ